MTDSDPPRAQTTVPSEPRMIKQETLMADGVRHLTFYRFIPDESGTNV